MTIQLFPVWGYEWSCYEHSCIGVCVDVSFHFSEINASVCNSGLHAKWIFNFIRNHKSVFLSGSTSTREWSSFFVSSPTFGVLAYFFVIGIFYFSHSDSYAIVVLMCISLIANDVHFPCACLSHFSSMKYQFV